MTSRSGVLVLAIAAAAGCRSPVESYVNASMSLYEEALEILEGNVDDPAAARKALADFASDRAGSLAECTGRGAELRKSLNDDERHALQKSLQDRFDELEPRLTTVREKLNATPEGREALSAFAAL